MRLSLVFELLLIFVLLAFAASRVIDSEGLRNSHKWLMRKSRKVGHKTRQDVNKYCSCSTKLCNCCREFNIPVVSLQGPGCATLQYLQGDKLAISMSFGERVLTNTTISGRKPKPVCMQLPGGVSKFCGRVYDVARDGEDFKACLGLELRSLQDIEASLRVSCFRFGPKGLKVEPAQPLPVVPDEGNNDEDDEDDEDDDDDDYDFDDEYNLDNDVDTADYTGFGLFDDDFVGDLFGVSGETDDVKVKKPKPVKKITVSSTKPPVKVNANKPTKVVRKPQVKVTTVKPPSKSTTRATQTTSTTTQAVKFEKMPEIVVISTSAPYVPPQEEKIPSTSHESIAAVTAMLQEAPTEIAQVEPIKMVPSTVVPTERTTEKIVEVVTTASPQSTDVTEDFVDVTTEAAEDEEGSSTEVVENLILRNEEEHDDDDDDEDDNEDDPISSAVEDVLGDDDEPKKKNSTTKVVKEKKSDKTKVTKEETDVVDDIVDGMMETLTGSSSNKKVPGKNVKHFKGFDYDDDDDDEYEDDDDDEDEARKMKQLKA